MSTGDIDEAALRERARALVNGHFGMVEKAHNGERLVERIAEALATEVAELRAEVERERENRVAAEQDFQAKCAELKESWADVARLTKEREEAVTKGRNDVLVFLREQAKAVPVGAEDKRRGASVYNWHLDAIARVERWMGLTDEARRALAETERATLVERCRALEGALRTIAGCQCDVPAAVSREGCFVPGRSCRTCIARRAFTPSIPGGGA